MNLVCFSGGFAKVKLGRHIQTGEKVAIKIMNKKDLGVSHHFIYHLFALLITNLDSQVYKTSVIHQYIVLTL